MTTTHLTPAPSSAPSAAPQHGLVRSILLHLLPGALLTVFIVAAAPVVGSWGYPPVFALFAGIGVVIVPIELGYLAVQSRRTTGSWSPLGAVTYRQHVPARRLAALTAGLFVWFLGLTIASMTLLDAWLAETFFAWMPEAILQFSAVDDAGDPLSSGALVIMLVVAFVFNGVLGPVTEELYFRGHLLPRIDRYGRWAPVLNTALFSLYHLWTPWQNPARIAGYLPITWATWRTRAVRVGVAAHVTINTVFLLFILAAYLAESA